MVKLFFRLFSTHSRNKRARLFQTTVQTTAQSTVLDLGSEQGHAIHRVLSGTEVRPENVSIADISATAVAEGRELYGYNPVVLVELALLPFANEQFDVVYCSSVIEHVTLQKARVWEVNSSREFKELAATAQSRFAAEIRRVGRSYFVQTPYRHFPIESHSWLPFLNWLSRPILMRVLRLTNRYWVKRTQPDFYLLNRREFQQLFPDAEIRVERFLGIPKSLIAIKTP